ncbi:MAG: hypothetical protein H7328_03525 [Bdellovibrio sp.]|nr:hypothetical protein [Bdellovibrio sp.]
MNFSISSIIAGFIFSVIGFWMLREAKKKSDLRLVVIAILLIAYTYFTPNPYLDWGVGAALCGLAYLIW